ncbi:ABC transporter substrate-binding protein [Longispora albida]|uniref:ABC transporter substrate-binding protein n=1 Tax=Longispora albida TaxID=203523 RepID=UPI0003711977|nr:ABC transporter substrate-binding protein [Longispora albida]
MRHSSKILAVGLLAVSLAASACGTTTNDGKGNNKPNPNAEPIIIDTKGEAVTPAPDVKGATKGGTILWLEDGEFSHFDPNQMYSSDELAVGTHLMYRMLTTFVEDPGGGPLKLVGDLATNTGVQSEGGKKWTYTLRDGIKYEDGTPITSKDIKYGIARQFGAQGAQGMQYIPDALDPKREYKGPADGNLNVPGIATPDDKTIIFTFPEAHPEFPFIAAYPSTAPTPQGKDTKEKYEDTWVASGPYKRKEAKKDQYMILERNPHWDPKTDPARHQYVDQFKFDWTPNRQNQTNRIKASQGEDAFAVMSSQVNQADITTVANDPEMSKRVIDGPTPFVTYMYINTQRVPDVNVRRAMNFAMNRDAYVKALGGVKVAKPATTLLAPIVPGYQNYNAYDGGVSGDLAKAKQALNGKKVEKLSLCFGNTPTGTIAANTIKESLSREGLFDIVLNPIDTKTYSDTVGKKDTKCDLISNGWAQDFPDGAATLRVLFDGKQIRAEGNQTLSYLDVPEINDELAKLSLEADRKAAAPKYAALDQKLMKDYAPVVPLTYTQCYKLVGSKVGGAYLSPLYNQVNLTQVYVKA